MSLKKKKILYGKPVCLSDIDSNAEPCFFFFFFLPRSPRLRQIDVASSSCVMQLRTAAVSNFSLWFDFERAFFFFLFYSIRTPWARVLCADPLG